MKSLRCVLLRHVLLAVENKYSGVFEGLVESCIDTYLDKNSVLENESLLLEASQPVASYSDEINNLIVCYLLIEYHWRCVSNSPLTVNGVFTVISGKSVELIQYRNSEIIPDFTDTIPVPVSGIDIGLAQIDHKMSLVDHYGQASVQQKAKYLSWIYRQIIAVHPYSDGNGRTARLVFQYTLRRWRYPYIELPKVRNSKKWKNTLNSAVSGNLGGLESFFFVLLSKNVSGG